MITTPITDSSQITEIAYDPSEQILVITFKKKGTKYAYTNVPAHIHDELIKAESKGKYFHQNIRGKFEYGRIYEEV